MTEAFFELRDGLYVPGDFCRGPWNRNSLHGRAIAALLAYGVESHVDEPSWHVARLTVDMFRLAPHQPVELRTDLVRDGNRVRAVDAALFIDGVEVARASSVLLRRSAQPPTERARVPAPPPEDVASDQPDRAEASGDFRDAWETRTLRDEAGDTAFVWIRMGAPLIGGVALTPLVRTAGASDYASPASNRSRPRLPFHQRGRDPPPLAVPLGRVAGRRGGRAPERRGCGGGRVPPARPRRARGDEHGVGGRERP